MGRTSKPFVRESAYDTSRKGASVNKMNDGRGPFSIIHDVFPTVMASTCYFKSILLRVTPKQANPSVTSVPEPFNPEFLLCHHHTQVH